MSNNKFFAMAEYKKKDSEIIPMSTKEQEMEEHSVKFVPKKFPQIVTALSAAIGCFALGTALGWSSPGIPALEDSGKLGVLSTSAKSWIGSIVTLGAVLSPWAAGFLMQRIGRKWTMVALGVPFVVGWVLIAASMNLSMILAGRFITGFCGGAFALLAPLYVSETVEDHIRGLLSTVSGVSLAAGILYSYILGAIMSWVSLSIACSVIPVLLIAAMIWMPESPRYLLEKGNEKAAATALMRLRGAVMVEQVDFELKLIEKSIQESNARPAGVNDFFEPCILKPIAISCTLMLFQQLSGINAVLFYAVDIFKSAGSDLNPDVSSIIIGAFPVLLVTICAFLVDKAGRKILFIISEVGIVISLAALGVFFTLKANNDGEVPENLGWLPLASLISYIITYNIAVGPLPWVVMGELLPPHIKGLAGAIGSSFCWGLGFVVSFTFADLSAWIGPEGCYFFFSAASVVGALFSAFVLPETKGKSLDQIQALFK